MLAPCITCPLDVALRGYYRYELGFRYWPRTCNQDIHENNCGVHFRTLDCRHSSGMLKVARSGRWARTERKEVSVLTSRLARRGRLPAVTRYLRIQWGSKNIMLRMLLSAGSSWRTLGVLAICTTLKLEMSHWLLLESLVMFAPRLALDTLQKVRDMWIR